MKTRKHVRIDAAALMQVGASSVLALNANALGGVVALAGEEPAADETMSSSSGSIAVLRIEGPMAQRSALDLCAYVDGYDALEARMALALEADTEGVLMIINSPGGDAAGLEEAVNRMAAMKAKSGKRVVAYVDEFAASAAYWLATVADEIVVPATGSVGSIGCIGAVLDLTEQQKQEGASWTIIREPAGKAEAMPYGPVTGLAVDRATERVKAYAQRFYKAVSKARAELSTRDVRAMNGALFMGAEAVAAGLADRVGTLESAAASAMKPKKSMAPKSQKGNGMKLLSLVAATLKLDADISDADAAEKLSAHLDSLNTRLTAEKTKAVRVDELEAELAALKSAKIEADKLAAVEAAIQAGVDARKVSPAKRPELLEKGKRHGAEWTQAVIDELPVLVSAAPPPPPANTGASDEAELSEREKKMCIELKLDAKDYAAAKVASMKKAG
jgi:ClpP class serine protease